MTLIKLGLLLRLFGRTREERGRNILSLAADLSVFRSVKKGWFEVPAAANNALTEDGSFLPLETHNLMISSNSIVSESGLAVDFHRQLQTINYLCSLINQKEIESKNTQEG
ncbi:hypothetical protein [Niabella terrae]